MPADGRDPVHALAEAVAGLRAESLGAATRSAARRLFADSLAVALAGRGCRDTEAVLRLAADWGGKRESGVLGTTLRVPAPTAALVNGTMIQALDFDDTDDTSAAHTASTVLAAALAVGEARGRSGRDLIAALVAGVEVVARIGRACAQNLGFTSTSLYGAFGAAAAASRLLNLDATATRHAFGIVLSQAAGSTQTALDWPLSKHIQSGFAAQAGVTSALLAEQGITGIENVFSGRYGFFALYKPGGHRVEPLVAPWHAPFAIEALSFKPYAACRGTHGAIEACERLVAEGVRADDVASVRVVVPQAAFTLAGQAFAADRDPVIAAQFSIRYTAAAALVHGRLSLAHFRQEAILDPRVQRLMPRISVETGTGGDFAPVRVEVTRADGGVRTHTIPQLPGGPGRDLDDAAMRAKIEDCLAFAPRGTTALDAEGLWRLVQSCESLEVSGLLAGLTAPQAAQLAEAT